MILELLPKVGVGVLRLGMTLGEAVAAVRELGFVPLDPDGGGGDMVLGLQVLCEHTAPETDVSLGFTKGALTDIHLYRFRIEDADVTVLLDGLDVFRTPSDELLGLLAERGHTVAQNDDGVDTLPDLDVILSNESSFDYPMDDEGDPIHFDYVLVTSFGPSHLR